MTKKHISFSELKIWAECPYKHKLKYIDKVKGFTGNIFTAFGTAIHNVCENIAKEELEPIDYDEFFDLNFLAELKKLDEKPDNKMIADFREQGKQIPSEVFPELKKHFGKFEVFSTEESLYQKIDELKFEHYLKGFIDLAKVSATSFDSVKIASVCPDEYTFICSIAWSTLSTTFTASFKSKNSVS